MHDPHRHPGFARVFSRRRLTLGVFFPIEAYRGDTPTLLDQERLARRAEELGFAALWFRDVPLRDPSFGDVGQIYDPWVYLGYIAAQTQRIALVTGAIVLPLRHPLHVAKAAASTDRLSGGRFLLGVASGDRAAEYAAFGVQHAERGSIFREHLAGVRRAFEPFPWDAGGDAGLACVDPVPKPLLGQLPILVTGRSQQSPAWIAEHADGFVTYPRPPSQQRELVATLRAEAARAGIDWRLPVAQSLYIDLLPSKAAFQGPIHLGYALGTDRLLELLEAYEQAGIEHVTFNLKYGRRGAAEVLEELGSAVLPHFQPVAERRAQPSE